jgi:hypothetical protein
MGGLVVDAPQALFYGQNLSNIHRMGLAYRNMPQGVGKSKICPIYKRILHQFCVVKIHMCR